MAVYKSFISTKVSCIVQWLGESMWQSRYWNIDKFEIWNKLFVFTEDKMKLEEQNREIKEKTNCIICCEATRAITFLPCGHLVCCAQCAPACSNCAVCRKDIKGTIKVTLAWCLLMGILNSSCNCDKIHHQLSDSGHKKISSSIFIPFWKACCFNSEEPELPWLNFGSIKNLKACPDSVSVIS